MVGAQLGYHESLSLFDLLGFELLRKPFCKNPTNFTLDFDDTFLKFEVLALSDGQPSSCVLLDHNGSIEASQSFTALTSFEASPYPLTKLCGFNLSKVYIQLLLMSQVYFLWIKL